MRSHFLVSYCILDRRVLVIHIEFSIYLAISSSTTFRDNYLEWPVNAPYKKEPAKYNPSEAPLESATCYRDDFVAKESRPVRYEMYTIMYICVLFVYIFILFCILVSLHKGEVQLLESIFRHFLRYYVNYVHSLP